MPGLFPELLHLGFIPHRSVSPSPSPSARTNRSGSLPTGAELGKGSCGDTGSLAGLCDTALRAVRAQG